MKNGFFMLKIQQRIFRQIKYDDYTYNYNYNYQDGTGENVIGDLQFELIPSDRNPTTGYNSDLTCDGSACVIVFGNNNIGVNLCLDNDLYNGGVRIF